MEYIFIKTWRRDNEILEFRTYTHTHTKKNKRKKETEREKKGAIYAI